MNKLVLSCEHYTNQIPEKYKYFFLNATEVLQTHKAFDVYAAEIYKEIADGFDFFIHGVCSRLLIDLNRSLSNKNLFSFYCSSMKPEYKKEIVETLYLPYRNKTSDVVEGYLKNGYNVLHVSLHTFTPVWKNQYRNCDIGILYDPSVGREKKWANFLSEQIKMNLPGIKIRKNYPYKGISDGHATNLRKHFMNQTYSGIELEFNQAACPLIIEKSHIFKEIFQNAALK